MATVEELLRSGVARLREAGSESPRLDVELLLARAVGVDRTTIIAHPEVQVGQDANDKYQRDVARRETGEPVAYIRGFKEFHGIVLATDRRTLIPRPETELLVDLAVTEVMGRLAGAPRPAGTPRLRVVDVGTGAGTIAVSLAVALRRHGADRDIRLLATDESPEALQLARENAVGHGVADVMGFLEADLLPPVIDAPFDLLLANLPYIPSDVVPTLPVAATFEPALALDGGPDGLRVIARLVERLPPAVAAGGAALLEIGSDQGDAISRLVAEALPGWTCRIENDLSGRPRVARLAPPA